MLPFFEEQNIFDQYDFTQNWDFPTAVTPHAMSNAGLVGRRLPVFECPSTPDDGRMDGDSQWWTPGYPDWTTSQVAAPTDYATICNIGAELAAVTPAIIDIPVAPNDLTGMMVRNLVCTLQPGDRRHGAYDHAGRIGWPPRRVSGQREEGGTTA